jgi:MFS transporter, DHA1 family, inner membrane transport protein
MDVDIPVVAVPGSGTASPPLTVSHVGDDTANRRTLAALGFGTFVAALVFVVPPIFFPQMAADLQVSVPLLGQTMSAMLALSVVLGLVIGPLADRSGYRFLILIGLLASVVCLLVFGLAPTFLLLFLASATGAVTDAGVLGPSLALAGTAFEGTAARRAIGWTTAAQAGSAIVGVPLLAAVGTMGGWRMAFVGGGLAAAAVLLLATRWLPRDHRPAATPLRLESLLAPYRPLLRDGTMRRLYGATVCGAVCWFGVVTYLGAFLVQTLGLGTGQVGLVYMIVGAGYCLGSLAVGGPLAGVPTRRLIISGFLATAILVGLAFSGRTGTPGAIIFITGVALMMGVEGVAMTTLLTSETPSGAGTTMTLSGSLFNLGAAGGSAIGGALLALSGYEALALGFPVFALGAAVLSWRPARVRALSIDSRGMQKEHDA